MILHHCSPALFQVSSPLSLETGVALPPVNFGLPCSHYCCFPTHMIAHTLLSPIYFFPLYSTLSVNFFSPKATVWLIPGLLCGPYFHPNCLTPTGTLRGVRLRLFALSSYFCLHPIPHIYTTVFSPLKITICAPVGVRKYNMYLFRTTNNFKSVSWHTV